MLKKLLCILGAGAMMLSFAACNSSENNEDSTKAAEPTTAFEKYIIAKEVYDVQATQLEELCTVDGVTYNLIDYNGKKCIASLTSQNNYKVYYEFNSEFEILSQVNKRLNGGYVYFLENPESETKRALKVFYVKNSMVVNFVPAPCSELVLLDVPESYEMYPYGFVAHGNNLTVIDLKDGSTSSYSRTLEELSMFFDAPDAFFAQGKRGAYTYTKLEALSRTHIKVSVLNVDSSGKEKTVSEFTFNPINGVAVVIEQEE